jgi:hypothetical protein
MLHNKLLHFNPNNNDMYSNKNYNSDTKVVKEYNIIIITVKKMNVSYHLTLGIRLTANNSTVLLEAAK